MRLCAASNFVLSVIFSGNKAEMTAQLCSLHVLDADGKAECKKPTTTAAPCPSDTQSKLQCHYIVFYCPPVVEPAVSSAGRI